MERNIIIQTKVFKRDTFYFGRANFGVTNYLSVGVMNSLSFFPKRYIDDKSNSIPSSEKGCKVKKDNILKIEMRTTGLLLNIVLILYTFFLLKMYRLFICIG